MAGKKKHTVPQKDHVNLREAALLVGVSTNTLSRAIAAGTLRAARFGPKTVRIARTDLFSLFRVQ